MPQLLGGSWFVGDMNIPDVQYKIPIGPNRVKPVRVVAADTSLGLSVGNEIEQSAVGAMRPGPAKNRSLGRRKVVA